MLIGALLVAWGVTLVKAPPPHSDDFFWGVVWILVGSGIFLRNLFED